jgi:hypothetical protein
LGGGYRESGSDLEPMHLIVSVEQEFVDLWLEFDREQGVFHKHRLEVSLLDQNFRQKDTRLCSEIRRRIVSEKSAP